MRIERLELLHLRIPLVHSLETSFGRLFDHEALVVRVESGGIVGYGEVSASAVPQFGPETVHTAWHVIRDFLAPRLKGQEIAAPGPISDVFALVHGHPMAKAGIEMAVLDLFGKAQNRPAWQILGGDRAELPAGVSFGVEEPLGELLGRIEEALARGYQRVTLRIRPKADVDVVSEVRRTFPTAPLAVDAGAAYTIADLDHLRALEPFELLLIEQPFDGNDLVDHARLQSRMRTPVCLGESIKSYDDARRASELGACRLINISPGRAGGPYVAKMIHNVARAHKIAAGCGGRLETGIGRAHNIALATLPNFTMPGDLAASDRFYAEDVIDPPVTVTAEGTILVPKSPGIGYNVVEKRLNRYCVRREFVLP